MNRDINTTKEFNDRIHLIGRVSVVLCLAAFIVLPIALSWIYKAPINFGITMKNALSILVMFTFSAICENLSYAPVIGAGALYTSCVTGDLSNMKVPAAINAMQVVNAEAGTEKGDIVSILAVSTCTFVTTGIALLGMLFLAPIIEPIYNHPIINPAFANMIPAILGALLIPNILKFPKESLPILAIPVIVILVLGREKFGQIQGYLLLVVAIISVLFSYLINKNKIKAGETGLTAEEIEEMNDENIFE